MSNFKLKSDTCRYLILERQKLSILSLILKKNITILPSKSLIPIQILVKPSKVPVELDHDNEDTGTNQLFSVIEAAINNATNHHQNQNNNKMHQDEDTEGFLFGRLIGKRLDKLDSRKRARCQIEIQSLLYKYEFDEY